MNPPKILQVGFLPLLHVAELEILGLIAASESDMESAIDTLKKKEALQLPISVESVEVSGQAQRLDQKQWFLDILGQFHTQPQVSS